MQIAGIVPCRLTEDIGQGCDLDKIRILAAQLAANGTGIRHLAVFEQRRKPCRIGNDHIAAEKGYVLAIAMLEGQIIKGCQSLEGSDRQELYVRNLADGKDLSDKIEWAKFTGIDWTPDDPVPMTPTRLPAKLTGSCGQDDVR